MRLPRGRHWCLILRTHGTRGTGGFAQKGLDLSKDRFGAFAALFDAK
jgi:hypothetical protein